MRLAGRCSHSVEARPNRRADRQSVNLQLGGNGQQQQQRQPTSPQPSTSGRRDILATALVAGFSLAVLPASADAADSPQVVSPVVQEYQRTAQKLVRGIRETIELELAGAPEREVRRKAEESNVKTLVKEFISKWQESPALFNDPSRAEIKAAVVELGAFYQQYGSRTKLPADVSNSILGHLSAAEGVLGPYEDKKGMFNIF